MRKRARTLSFVPALCALLIVLRLTVIKTPGTSDVTLGATVGMLLGISIVSILALRRGHS